MYKRVPAWLLPGLLFCTLVAPQIKANESKSNLRWYLGIAGGNNTPPTDRIPDATMIIGGKDILTRYHTKFMEVRCFYLVLLN